eukprot:CAMPEP_0118651936 /NCGR_PEP_ID=MMETSP0785-20121206/11049_1 /TAXON_ID=91992 /ORGANISM="Bolidomonas pacifica, Strain CCMP 1866" /LENGTH=112 /DNA_ID=CAMNT_0006544417 /DNA_START=73 /DNA_END=408 /DNA_ORIENTATION=-
MHTSMYVFICIYASIYILFSHTISPVASHSLSTSHSASHSTSLPTTLPTTLPMHSFLSYEDYQLAYDGLHHVTSPLAYKNNVEVLSSRTSPGCEYGTSYHLGFNPEDLMEVF